MISKSKWLIKEAKLRIKYMTSKDCIFCKIIAGEIKSRFIKESDMVIAFSDTNPVSKVHILVVPKTHIESVMTIDKKDGPYLIEMFKVAGEITKEMNLDGFRLAFNAGRFQHVHHLHMHILAGEQIKWSKL